MPEFRNETYTIDMIISKILTDDRQYDISKLISAYEFAAKCHEGQVRSSGEPYIIHPVAVAYILLELGMDTDTLCAAWRIPQPRLRMCRSASVTMSRCSWTA